jgi:hypothetical protein
MCLYLLVISLVYWSLWCGSFLGGYEVMNCCMFTCVISHLIWLQVGCSGTVVETLLPYGIWRIPVLSCGWSFRLCRGCCVSECYVVAAVAKVFTNGSKLFEINLPYSYTSLLCLKVLIVKSSVSWDEPLWSPVFHWPPLTSVFRAEEWATKASASSNQSRLCSEVHRLRPRPMLKRVYDLVSEIGLFAEMKPSYSASSSWLDMELCALHWCHLT